MGKCGNCGAKTSSVGTIVMAVAGLGLAALVGIPLMIVVLLTAIAAMGSSANEEFSNVSQQIHGTTPEDYQFSGALDHVPATAEFDPSGAEHREEDFTAAQ